MNKPYECWYGQLVVVQLKTPLAVATYAGSVSAPNSSREGLQPALRLIHTPAPDNSPALTNVLVNAVLSWYEGRLIARMVADDLSMIDVSLDPGDVVFVTRVAKEPSRLVS